MNDPHLNRTANDETEDIHMLHVRFYLFVLTALVACGSPPAAEVPTEFDSTDLAGEPISVEDAIRMVRIQDRYGMDDGFVVFSPDGSKFATVVWHGDLERDVNVFSLLVFDVEEALSSPRATPSPVLTLPFHGDSTDQTSTPIDQLSFLADNRRIAFLGTLEGEPRQVHAVDIETGEVETLTRHPTAVKDYSVDHDGGVKLYAAEVPDDVDSSRIHRIRDDGVSPYDGEIFPEPRPHNAAATVLRNTDLRNARQYFTPASRSDIEPTMVFDSRRSRRETPSKWEIAMDTVTHSVPQGDLAYEPTLERLATFSVDPTGEYAVMWPYILGDQSIDTLVHDAWEPMNLFSRSLAAYFGLVDLSDGSIEPLLDQLFVPFLARDGGQLWAPDGKSVLVQSLLPLDAASSEVNEARAAEPPTWLEVQVPSRDFERIPIPDGWTPIRWDEGTDDLILRRADSLAAMRKADGDWGVARDLGVVEGFNRRRPVTTNGRIVIGVQDSLTLPPDLAAFDLSTGETTLLTDLNPQLRDRKYGKVELLEFQTPNDSVSTGWLIHPVGFEPGRRHPLVVLLQNERQLAWDRSYMIDGRFNLSGHAIQPLSAAGFMVLFIGEPASLRVASPEEGEVMRTNVERAIRELVDSGDVDPRRVGVSGWSRSGYYVDNLLIHSSFPFAAATQIDGGTRDYNDGMRPYTDGELGQIRTPLLLQPHGLTRLVFASAMADRMSAMGKPVEVLYFEEAPHSTIQPRHRWRSLTTHVDWWQFWLRDQEDPDPEKERQYERWRDLRTPEPE